MPRVSQHAAFALLQAEQRHRLRHGVVPMATGGRMLTCVVRLPAELADAVHQAVRDLAGAERHYVYPATDLHLTLLNLDRADSDAVAATAAVLADTAPFPMDLHGLGISQQSVYVRAFDDGGLLALRRRMMAVTGAQPAWPLRRLGFVNVIRYASSDVEDLEPAVRARRRLVLGGFEIAAAELVRTDKVLSVAGTTLLQRIAFESAGATPTGRLWG